MTLKEFGENAEITVQTIIKVNDEVVHHVLALDIDEAISDLGKAERHNLISKAIQEQYEDLPEPIEDESRGFND